ncbi:hypothetical protein BC629DRAFT_1591520 [Irpex lacteus]|nr:hypothetical protein BC629DRAFT_1591520 [Irpex lacteus]
MSDSAPDNDKGLVFINYFRTYDLFVKATDSDALYGVEELDLVDDSAVIFQLIKSSRRECPWLGGNAGSPFVLPMFRQDLDTLLKFYSGKKDVLEDFLSLTRVLQTATSFKMNRTRRRVISVMSKHFDFPRDPAMLLRLGHVAKVRKWFQAGYRDVILRPLSNLTLDDCKTISPELLHHLIQSKDHIEAAQFALLKEDPSFPSSSYWTARAWKEASDTCDMIFPRRVREEGRYIADDSENEDSDQDWDQDWDEDYSHGVDGNSEEGIKGGDGSDVRAFYSDW